MGNDPYNGKSVTFFSSAIPVITPIKREIQYKNKNIYFILFYFGLIIPSNTNLLLFVSCINFFF